MIGFDGLLAGNKARTEVLPLPITRARLIYWSADMRVKSIHRIAYLPLIKYRRSTITLNYLFLEQAQELLCSLCLV